MQHVVTSASSFTLRVAGSIALATSVAFAAACNGNVASPTISGSGAGAGAGLASLSASGPGSASMSAGQTKIDVCHRTEGIHEYILINIADPALPAHMAPGDASPGETIPNLPGKKFGENCEVLDDGGDPDD